MQEDIEQRTISVTVQASKLTGRVLKAAIAAVLQKMEQERNTPNIRCATILRKKSELTRLNGPCISRRTRRML